MKIFLFICLVSIINGYPSSIDENTDCSNYCLNDGVCVLINNNRQCYCLPEWEGEICENEREYDPTQMISMENVRKSSFRLHQCDLVPPNLCNVGFCQFENGSYSCACPKTHVGPRCERESPCNFPYCVSGAACSVDENEEPICDCPPTHTGSRCQNPVPTNASATTTTTTTLATTDAKCASYQQFCGVGKCVNVGSTSLRCECPPTHYGSFCEFTNSVTQGPSSSNPGPVNPTPVNPGSTSSGIINPPSGNDNPCSSNPCLNARPCYNNGNTFYCHCGNSFTGSRCETPAG